MACTCLLPPPSSARPCSAQRCVRGVGHSWLHEGASIQESCWDSMSTGPLCAAARQGQDALDNV
eukprot:321308-Pelagomonas_calceolata.AAC.1